MQASRSWLGEHIYILYAITFSAYVINVFIKNEIINYMIGVIAIFLLITSFHGASKLFKVLCIVFSVIGLILFFYAGISIIYLPLYMTSNMPLLSFLTVLPLMTSVVHSGRFDRRLNELMRGNVGDLGKLYFRSSFTTYILTGFINISALTLSQEVLQSSLKNIPQKVKKQFISKSTLRALAVALVWSPMEIIVAITVDSTGVSYLSLLPWLLLCSFLIIALDWAMGKRMFRKIEYQNGFKKQINIKKVIAQILKLFIALSVFLIIVVFTGSYLHLNFILSVTIVIPIFTICWASVIKRWKSFKIIGMETWKMRTNKLQNFVVLFISLSLFSTSLSETSFQDIIKQPFVTFIDYPIVILIFIQIVFFLGGLIGVHAIATIGVLFEVIQPLYDMINPLSIGVVMITSALSTATVGAYGVTVTMTSVATQQNPYKITLNNIPFSIIFGGIGISIGYFLL